MNDETPFLDALCADPTDATLLLVYADWLEERGDARREYIRLTQAPLGNEARIEELKEKFDPEWVSFIELSGRAQVTHRMEEELQRH